MCIRDRAYCDLSLPDYTSKVINVGIQQGGIPDGVPEKMRESTMENLQIFMDEDTPVSYTHLFRNVRIFFILSPIVISDFLLSI